MSEISVQCSHCGVKLKLKDTSKIGKTVPCPKCKKPFVVQAPAEDEFDFSFDDTEAVAETAPVAAPRSKAKSKKKGKSGPSGSKAGLFIGLGALALLVLTGVGLWAAGVFSRGEPEAVAQQPNSTPPAAAHSGAPTTPPAHAGAPATPPAHGGAAAATPATATAMVPASTPSGSASTAAATPAPASTTGGALSTAWLPDDCEVLVHVRVADILATPLLKNVLANPQVQQQLAQAVEQMGIAPADVESVTLGVPALTRGLIQGMNSGQSEQEFTESIGRRAVAVVRTRRPIDAPALKLDQRGEAASHAGKPYYRLAPPEDPGTLMAVAFVEPATVLLGQEPSVQEALSRGAGSGTHARFSFVDPTAQLLVVLAPHEFDASWASLASSGAQPPPPLVPLKDFYDRGARAAAVELSLAGGLRLAAAVNAADSDSGDRLHEELQALIPQAQGQAAMMANQPGPQQVVVGMVRPLLDRLATSRDGQVARLTTSLTEPELQQMGGVATAMLLPAVLQGRTAARRAQASNNLKQIALALHNHHDLHKSFPSGTRVVPGLAVEERVAWTADLLPFFDQDALHKQIDFTQGWKSDRNATVLRTPMTVFLNPGAPQVLDSDDAVTQYVGLAGLGEDGPTLPVTSPRAGVVAYDRATSMANIRDGTSNTAMISEVSDGFGPWAAGGRPTLRALTAKPYINGPDGIGGPFEGGFHIGLADGRVHFVSQDIDPTVLEALLTINGGEKVDDF